MDADLQEFIQDSFKTVWALELMLFLRRGEDRAWGVDELVRELRGSEPVVLQSLSTLQVAGLVLVDEAGQARFAPASPALRASADAVEAAYREKPNAVRRLIMSAPSDKLQTLADAFRLRKD